MEQSWFLFCSNTQQNKNTLSLEQSDVFILFQRNKIKTATAGTKLGFILFQHNKIKTAVAGTKLGFILFQHDKIKPLSLEQIWGFLPSHRLAGLSTNVS